MKMGFDFFQTAVFSKNHSVKKILFLLVFSYCFDSYSQSITTTETLTPTQLIQDVLFNTSCATISNVTVSGGNFSSGEKSWGYFNANGTSFPFGDGIILSTGKVVNAQGPNSFISDDGGSMGWTGDSDLNLALGISNSLNATLLEFDFVPLGSQISFDYIFSSEEYHGTATCQYSDGFAFLLKAVGDVSYQNLAVIPNTTIPVKVTSVHPEIPGGCPAQNEQYFGSFNDVDHPTNFNGQTTILTAQATVIPGTTYHIKLVIADEGNYRYDSAIFIKGSSFNFGVDLGQDRTFNNNNPVCPNETVTLNATSTSATNYQWNFNGSPITSETSPSFTLLPPYTSAQNGTYSVDVTYSPTCTVTSTIELEFAPDIVVNQQVYSFCDDDAIQDGIRVTNLADLIPTLFTNLPSNYTVAFFDSPTSSNPLPFSYQNTTPFSQVIYAKITNINCYAAVPVTLTILTFDEIILDESITICSGQSATLIADGGFSSYVWNTSATSQAITVSTAGTYTVVIENAVGCTKIKTFTVIVSEIATVTDVVINGLSYEDNSAEIVFTGNGSYLFSIDGINYQSSPVFYNVNMGEHTAFVLDQNQCGIASENFYMYGIPNYFTPNGDGIHDYWNIKGLDSGANSNSIISIFNRFGKFIKQISVAGRGWDGTYNGTQLPADDYWFSVELSNGRTAKGHFSLKR